MARHAAKARAAQVVPGGHGGLRGGELHQGGEREHKVAKVGAGQRGRDHHGAGGAARLLCLLELLLLQLLRELELLLVEVVRDADAQLLAIDGPDDLLRGDVGAAHGGVWAGVWAGGGGAVGPSTAEQRKKKRGSWRRGVT